jgi:Fur family ferric uptake transcriptional regulator
MKTSSVDQLIMDKLNSENEHFTSPEIYFFLKSKLPAVNRSTVYRSLERLVSGGKASVSDLGTGALVYEMVGEGKHHHLVCQQCHRIIVILHDDVEQFFKQITQKSKYKITTNHLILYGVCSDCQAN